jgi:hypothetical protein
MATVSQAGYFNLQAFTDLGALGVGMRLYTYAQGTTTQKVAYTDAAGSVAQTYTSDGIGGQYIAMNARGELPSPLYLTSGSYDLALKTSAGATVWTRRADATGADMAASGGSASIGYLPAGTGAVARTLQEKIRESVSVKDFGAVGDGSTDDTAEIQAAIDAVFAAGGGTLFFPPGNYLHITQLVFKNEITYVGYGWGATRLTYTGTDDQVVIQNPLSTLVPLTAFSTDASIHVHGIYFNASSINSLRANVFDTGSTFLTFHDCFFASDEIGVALSQSELVDFYRCYFAGAKVGLWLINDSVRTANTRSYFTNRIGVHSCQFNGGAGYIGIADDGGSVHAVNDCNFNAGSTYIRSTANHALLVRGGEFESADTTGILFATTTWQGAASPASDLATIDGAFFTDGASVPVLTIQASGVGTLNYNNNYHDTAGAVYSGINNVTQIRAIGNYQAGAGTATTNLNTDFDAVFFQPVWTAASVNPAIGNGSINGSFSRTGRRVSYTVILTIGTTTTLGTGNWLFSIPQNADSYNDIGPSFYVVAGAVYVGIARMNTGTDLITCYAASNTANGVQSTVPAAWVNSNTLEFTIEYTALNRIG